MSAFGRGLTGDDSPPSRSVLIRRARSPLLPVPWRAPELLTVPEPTRVAFAGCWHGKSQYVEETLRAARAAGAEAVVHTGDFLYTSPAANESLTVMERVASDLGLFVVAVRGNHDEPALFQRAVTATRRRNRAQVVADGFARLSPHVLHAPNGLRWTWRGVGFVALGGAYSVDRPARVEGATYWAGETATTREINEVKRGGHAHVMITHDIPTGANVPMPVKRPEWWDVAGAEADRQRLQSAVEVVRPHWVIGGHLHIRHTGGMWLNGAHQVRVEVLDKIENGIGGNLLIADLVDGSVAPVADALRSE